MTRRRSASRTASSSSTSRAASPTSRPAADAALADVAKGVAGGRRAVVSGFTDATGDPAKNEELAKARATAVQAALTAAGVATDKIDLKKPEAVTASGSNAEARRVEVSLI